MGLHDLSPLNPPPPEQTPQPPERALVIACGVLRLDIQRLAPDTGLALETRFLEGGLHENPPELRRRLQAAIDQGSSAGKYTRIVVGYGVCGRGTVGLRARDVPLVLPRVHDCIALFLGSDRAYREQFSRCPGTYYVSAGWHAEKNDPLSQKRPFIFMAGRRVYFDELARQVGDEAARETFDFHDSWKRNYRRAVFIDTGAGEAQGCAAHARDMAARYGWRYERIAGDSGLLRRMLSARSATAEILVVPPGYATEFDPLAGGLRAAPLLAESAGQATSNSTAQWAPEAERVSNEIGSEGASLRIGLGIDAGGTYTDAVLFDLKGRTVLGKHKALTTKWDFTRGIAQALDGLDARELSRVNLVALSTTLATNAIVEGDGQTVGLLLMTPYGLSDPDEIPYEPKTLIQGTMEISGRVGTPVDEGQIRRAARDMVARRGVQAFAVSGFAGAVNPIHEITVKRVVQAETGCLVTCGHELSSLLNFKTRAETAVLNARIVPRLVKLLDDLEHVLRQRRISAPVMVVKGDGTLMGRTMAAERPVETILSGPAASVAGARFLTGCSDALVVDMGGTTTDTAALVRGQVEIAPSGSRVGRAQTHVRALKIRTCGLGGDSLIAYQDGDFTIGPRRVAPLAWLARHHEGFDRVADEWRQLFRRNPGNSKFMTVLALTGDGRDRLILEAPEGRLLDLLAERPFTLDALARRMGTVHPMLLPLARLEEHGLVQRCGLTPTDLLHVSGEFVCWDAGAARRAADLMAELAGIAVDELVERLKRRMVRRLAAELIKKQLESETDPEALDTCPVCRVLMGRMLQDRSATGKAGYRVTFSLADPVVGIGAPIHHFLPPAAKLLGARAVMPEHADVANAVGAVTSHIRVEREVKIRPDESGGYYVEGLPQAPRFAKFDLADRFAREALTARVAALAQAAGTSQRSVEIHHQDRTARTALGEILFLERSLTARLQGRPDRVAVAEAI